VPRLWLARSKDEIFEQNVQVFDPKEAEIAEETTISYHICKTNIADAQVSL